ncbi:MAG: HD domain-containing phosphohydrolase [Deinococcota bacterium]
MKWLIMTWMLVGWTGLASQVDPANEPVPVAERGVLDLRNWDFDQGAAPLYGELGFSWQALLSTTEATDTYLVGTWEGGFPGTDYGYATYRFTLLLPDNVDSYGLEIDTIPGAYRLWINGRERNGTGTVGTTRATTSPQWLPQTVIFGASQGRAEITMQLANFRYPVTWLSSLEGGYVIGIGTAEHLVSRQQHQLLQEVFVVIVLLVVAVYHLLLLAVRSQDKLSSFWLGILCLAVAFSDIVNGHNIAALIFPGWSFETLIRLEIMADMSVAVWSLLYLSGLFPEFRGVWMWGFVSVFSLLMVPVSLLPIYTIEENLYVLAWLGLAVIGYVLVGSVRAFHMRRESINGLLLGITIVTTTVSLDLLTVLGVVYVGDGLISYGFMGFVFIQASLLARRSANAYKRTQQAYEDSIHVLGLALEHRDDETKGHTDRVTDLALRVAHEMGLDNDARDALRRGAYLHDIGKIAIPDAILRKPGQLSAEEWQLMRNHTVIGNHFVAQLSFLPQGARDVVLYHHEKYDGRGYPAQLAGEDIPLLARIFTVVDVYDALTSKRPYKPAWTHERALAEIRCGAGDHFDPDVVAAFVRIF